jgi:hypothetical protein
MFWGGETRDCHLVQGGDCIEHHRKFTGSINPRVRAEACGRSLLCLLWTTDTVSSPALRALRLRILSPSAINRWDFRFSCTSLTPTANERDKYGTVLCNRRVLCAIGSYFLNGSHVARNSHYDYKWLTISHKRWGHPFIGLMCARKVARWKGLAVWVT